MNFAGIVTLNRNAVIASAFILLFIVYYYEYGNENHDSDKVAYIDVRDLLAASIDAAKRGGVKVFKIRESASLGEKSKGETNEGANDPVTAGDMLSHIEMFHSLRKVFPYIKILSEEKSSHKYNDEYVDKANFNVNELKNIKVNSRLLNSKDVLIWIDPLDATQEYTEDLRQYVTTMVCVAVKGVPIIGVIHKPFENFTAWAYVNYAHNPEMTVAKINKVPPADRNVRIIVSRSHKGPVVSIAEKAFGKQVSITDAGGAGYKTLEVISGRQDVYVHKTLIKKWDICAGNAILNHLGGKMTTLRGHNIDYSSSSDYKNPDGLIASLENHKFYVDRLKNL